MHFSMQTFDSFVTVETCNEIVQYCENVIGEVDENPLIIKQYRIRFRSEFLREKMQKKLSEFIVSDLFSYVKYENDGFIFTHYDQYREMANHTLLLYLNDDYENGETYIVKNEVEIKIEKKIGKAIIFKGTEIPHGCYKVNGIKRILAVKLLSL